MIPVQVLAFDRNSRPLSATAAMIHISKTMDSSNTQRLDTFFSIGITGARLQITTSQDKALSMAEVQKLLTCAS